MFPSKSWLCDSLTHVRTTVNGWRSLIKTNDEAQALVASRGLAKSLFFPRNMHAKQCIPGPQGCKVTYLSSTNSSIISLLLWASSFIVSHSRISSYSLCSRLRFISSLNECSHAPATQAVSRVFAGRPMRRPAGTSEDHLSKTAESSVPGSACMKIFLRPFKTYFAFWKAQKHMPESETSALMFKAHAVCAKNRQSGSNIGPVSAFASEKATSPPRSPSSLRISCRMRSSKWSLPKDKSNCHEGRST